MEKFRTRIGAQVKGFSMGDFVTTHKADRYLAKASQFAIAGTKCALDDAGLQVAPRGEIEGRYELSNIDPYRIGAILGVGAEDMEIIEQTYHVFLEHGPRRVSPFALPHVYTSSVVSNVTERFGIRGATHVVTSACASSNHAIAESYNRLQDGPEQVMLTGGADACVTPFTFAGFMALRAMSTRNDAPEKASRPFDLDRDGFVMGEGAGIIILEELNHALERGAPIYGELIGYGMTADAFHVAEPEPHGTSLAVAIQRALDMGGLAPQDVDYINAHGTSTKLNDSTETLAIKRVFGNHAYQLPISSTKSMIGHLIGAAGGVEAIASLLTMQNSLIHPTINLETPDPECDLDYVTEGAREKDVKVTLSVSAGFGGVNCVILLKAFEP
jgi:3-oxoacyl-[acyl-carrier-protein] synthase II